MNIVQIKINNAYLININNYNIIDLTDVNLTIKYYFKELWSLKKEYAQYGWVLSPDPETHDLFYIFEKRTIDVEAIIHDNIHIDEKYRFKCFIPIRVNKNLWGENIDKEIYIKELYIKNFAANIAFTCIDELPAQDEKHLQEINELYYGDEEDALSK